LMAKLDDKPSPAGFGRRRAILAAKLRPLLSQISNRATQSSKAWEYPAVAGAGGVIRD
jgi:hypothetical protein